MYTFSFLTICMQTETQPTLYNAGYYCGHQNLKMMIDINIIETY